MGTVTCKEKNLKFISTGWGIQVSWIQFTEILLKCWQILKNPTETFFTFFTLIQKPSHEKTCLNHIFIIKGSGKRKRSQQCYWRKMHIEPFCIFHQLISFYYFNCTHRTIQVFQLPFSAKKQQQQQKVSNDDNCFYTQLKNSSNNNRKSQMMVNVSIQT